jgi:hypothetical protein
MIDPIFDLKAQEAKSSIDDALGVAQRVQQRLGTLPPMGAPPRPGAPVQPPQAPRPQPFGQPPQAVAPQAPATPAAWPTVPGANPLLQQLATQYAAKQTQPPVKSFARGGLAVFG